MSIPGLFPVGTSPVGAPAALKEPPPPPDVTDFLEDNVATNDELLAIIIQLGIAIETLSLLDSTSFNNTVPRTLAESLTATDELDSHAIAVLIENILCTESFTQAWEALAELSEHVNVGEVFTIFLSDQLAESIDLTDLWSSFRIITTLQDLMRVNGVVDTMLETNVLLAEALAFKDLIDYVLGADLSELINLSEAFQNSFLGFSEQLDAIQIADALDYGVIITVLVDESMPITDEINSTAEMLRMLEENIGIGVKLTSDTGVYEGWVMNTMTGGASLYQGFPFNSFALHSNQKYLGATEDGIYELAGDDDDGTQIDAGLKTGLKDFGSTLSKRMVDAWFTMTAGGEMLLKTTTGEDEGKVERWYLVKKTPRMHRAKMARGVKAMFWQFELENIDGVDFDLDNMALHPLPLNRRY